MKRKKILALIIGASIAFTISTTSVFAEDIKMTHNLNLRAGPSTNNSILTTLPKGTIVNSLSVANNGWHKVEYNGKIGFLSNNYVQTVDSPPEEGTEAKTNENLHLRIGSGVSNKSITVIPKGANVKVIEKQSNGWWKISYKGKTGYSSKYYLTETTLSEPIVPEPVEPNSPSVSGSNIIDLSNTEGNNTHNLNMRKNPGVDNQIIVTIPKGTKIKIKGKDIATGWYLAEYNGKSGFVSNKYVRLLDNSTVEVIPKPEIKPTPEVEETPGKEENTETIEEVRTGKYRVNLRSNSSTNSSVLTIIPSYTGLEYIETDLQTGWYKVKYNGHVGFITNQYATKGFSLGYRALELAKTKLGSPYLWGAEGTEDYDGDGDTRDGFDCSGLTQWAYYKAGYYIPRTTLTGYDKGELISRRNVKIGDLIYFKTGNSSRPVDHVGIYAGNQTMIHASGTAGKVLMSNVYWDKMVSVRRH